MFRVHSAVSRGFRLIACGLVVVMAVLAVSADSADARQRRKRTYFNRNGYSPPYASIVVDVNSGRVLEQTNADSLRHPASLTKIMTLYLLFERLEAGKIKLNTTMHVSEHASVQAPTKLGLKPGKTLEVEDAIRALVTKSANDAAVVIAETIADNEGDFAKLMTKKARALGMSRTVYRNASGLPNDDQVTTARDQATLGRAIQERFPRYYRYFATPSFTYRGDAMRNHNRLLGRVDGVDGIKTGYTNASGFNLVTSVRRNNRHIVAVVLGGRSAGARDARMRDLIEEKISMAATKRTVPMLADASEQSEERTKPRSATAPSSGFALATASTVPVAPPPSSGTIQKPVLVSAQQRAPAPSKVAERSEIVAAPTPAERPAPGSADPLKPILVKTIKVKFNSMQTASLARAVPPAHADAALSTQSVAAPVQKSATVAVPAEKEASAVASPHAAKSVAPPPAAKLEPAVPPARAHTGWMIQVGAFDAEDEAKQRLNSAQNKAKNLLAHADAFTEVVVKGDKTLYRARFAVVDKDHAEAACRHLKRNDIVCMTIKN